MKNKSFTIIELLTVISVIGLMGTIVLVSLQGVREKARDAKRVQDLDSLQKALELYFTDMERYPYWTGSSSDEGVCAEDSPELSAALSDYLIPIPKAPLYKSSACLAPFNENCYCYVYMTSAKDKYKLLTKLERNLGLSQGDRGVYANYYEVFAVSEEDSSQIPFGSSGSWQDNITQISCGELNPCPTELGLVCVGLSTKPIIFRCAKPDPCSYYECPSESDCDQLEKSGIIYLSCVSQPVPFPL